MGRYGQAGKLMEGVATGNGMKALELVVPNPKPKADGAGAGGDAGEALCDSDGAGLLRLDTAATANSTG